MQKRIKRWWNGQRVPVYHDGETEGPGGMGKLPDEWVTAYSPSASATRKVVKWASSALSATRKGIIGISILAAIPPGYLALKEAKLLPSFLDHGADRPAENGQRDEKPKGKQQERMRPISDGANAHSKPPVAPSEAQPEASRPGVSRAQ